MLNKQNESDRVEKLTECFWYSSEVFEKSTNNEICEHFQEEEPVNCELDVDPNRYKTGRISDINLSDNNRQNIEDAHNVDNQFILRGAELFIPFFDQMRWDAETPFLCLKFFFLIHFCNEICHIISSLITGISWQVSASSSWFAEIWESIHNSVGNFVNFFFLESCLILIFIPPKFVSIEQSIHVFKLKLVFIADLLLDFVFPNVFELTKSYVFFLLFFALLIKLRTSPIAV